MTFGGFADKKGLSTLAVGPQRLEAAVLSQPISARVELVPFQVISLAASFVSGKTASGFEPLEAPN